MAKIRVNISLDPDTVERLKRYAAENHMNVSQSIEQWIWQEKLESEPVKKDDPYLTIGS